jgi:hypothetical protein
VLVSLGRPFSESGEWIILQESIAFVGQAAFGFTPIGMA